MVAVGPRRTHEHAPPVAQQELANHDDAERVLLTGHATQEDVTNRLAPSGFREKDVRKVTQRALHAAHRHGHFDTVALRDRAQEFLYRARNQAVDGGSGVGDDAGGLGRGKDAAAVGGVLGGPIAAVDPNGLKKL